MDRGVYSYLERAITNPATTVHIREETYGERPGENGSVSKKEGVG